MQLSTDLPVLSLLARFALVSGAAVAIVPKQSCWTGEIHSPCNGFETGCTEDGIKVRTHPRRGFGGIFT
ncbi:hypothetical protein SCUP234_02998 [Seiridium cupressi]